MTRRAAPIDMKWIDLALELAERGRFTVSPNPMVGAVIVRGGRVVGTGFHRNAGGPHAEVSALAKAGRLAAGADLYVTLEPCAHLGRTPPCTEAILAAGIRRLVVAARDPNPLVAGRGFSALRRGGVRILAATPEQRRRAELQNERFLVWIRKRRPFVLAKWAGSLDGRIATARGKSRWITGPEARKRALLLREEFDAVLVGAGTVLADAPSRREPDHAAPADRPGRPSPGPRKRSPLPRSRRRDPRHHAPAGEPVGPPASRPGHCRVEPARPAPRAGEHPGSARKARSRENHESPGGRRIGHALGVLPRKAGRPRGGLSRAAHPRRQPGSRRRWRR